MAVAYQNGKPIIEMKNISKSFSGVAALTDITFDVFPGEIHCLCGENGAGKSTLMKIMSGAYRPNGGSITLGEKQYKTLTPSLSKQKGISIIYQENDLVQTINAVENIFIGNEKTIAYGLVNKKEQKKIAHDMMVDMGIQIDLDINIEKMSVSDQQFVKILKALVFEPKILIMDEPTSMFNVEDSKKVLALTKRITQRGIGIVYISHFLNEVVQIADRITVIRDGSVVSTKKNENVTISDITTDMVGRSVDMFYSKEENELGDIMLEVQDLQVEKNGPKVSFSVRKGEILGFSGMVGSGRTEIMRALTGADRAFGGTVKLHGQVVDTRTPQKSIRAGFAHITEDRQRLGLCLHASVLENALVVALMDKIKGFFFRMKSHPKTVESLVSDLKIKTASVWQEARYLSGGNQQKVVLAKWLLCDQEVFIFDEPTRGIDINAKSEFYKQMSNLTKAGKCILMVSSDMPELISMSDRVMVIRNGKITAELQGEQIQEKEIIVNALGV